MSSTPRYIPHYTVEDYQSWKGDWELWDGVPIAMTPSPFGPHQSFLVGLAAKFKTEIDRQKRAANVLVEIDWIVSDETVVRPDFIVVCGDVPSRHVMQTPAIVAEITSASTEVHDRGFKFDLYAESRVPYYMILDPHRDDNKLYQFAENGYVESSLDHMMTFTICNNCQIDVDFESLI